MCDYVSYLEIMVRFIVDKVLDGIGMSGFRKIMVVIGVDKVKFYIFVVSFRLSVF